MFYKAKRKDLAHLMLEAVGWPLLGALFVTMEDNDDKSWVFLCMEGVWLGVHLAKARGMYAIAM